MTATTSVTYDDTKNYELLADCNENQEHYIILDAWKGLCSYIFGLVGEMFVSTNHCLFFSFRPLTFSPSPLLLIILRTALGRKTRIKHSE